MEVILLERVPHLGQLGDKVRVKPGFGRNFLIPTGRALPATKANLISFEARRAEIEAAANQRLEKAKERALLLEGLNITIVANAGEEAGPFGPGVLAGECAAYPEGRRGGLEVGGREGGTQRLRGTEVAFLQGRGYGGFKCFGGIGDGGDF